MAAPLGRGFRALLIASAALASQLALAEPPMPPPRPPDLQTEPPARTPPSAPAAPAASAPAPAPGADACLAALKSSGVEAEAATAPPAPLAGCGIEAPVRLKSIGLGSGAALDLPGRPLLDCGFARTFAGFVQDLVAPLAAASFGAPVAALDTGPGYECRGRDHVAGAKVSAHGSGIAIDVAAIALAGGRRIAIGRAANAQEEQFVRTLRRAACGWFTTVLGPGSDPEHADHLHLDVLRHGASDNYRICE